MTDYFRTRNSKLTKLLKIFAKGAERQFSPKPAKVQQTLKNPDFMWHFKESTKQTTLDNTTIAQSEKDILKKEKSWNKAEGNYVEVIQNV